MSVADLKLSYKLDRADYWDGQARLMRQGPWRAVTIAFALWMIAVLVGSFYVLQGQFQWGAFEIALVSLTGLLGLTLLAAIAMHFVGRFNTNRALKHAEAGPLAPVSIEIGAEGINWQAGESETWYTWSAFQRVEVTDRLILFYTSPVQAIMIPRRVFGGEDAMLSFVGDTRERIINAQQYRGR